VGRKTSRKRARVCVLNRPLCTLSCFFFLVLFFSFVETPQGAPLKAYKNVRALLWSGLEFANLLFPPICLHPDGSLWEENEKKIHSLLTLPSTTNFRCEVVAKKHVIHAPSPSTCSQFDSPFECFPEGIHTNFPSSLTYSPSIFLTKRIRKNSDRFLYLLSLLLFVFFSWSDARSILFFLFLIGPESRPWTWWHNTRVQCSHIQSRSTASLLYEKNIFLLDSPCLDTFPFSFFHTLAFFLFESIITLLLQRTNKKQNNKTEHLSKGLRLFSNAHISFSSFSPFFLRSGALIDWLIDWLDGLDWTGHVDSPFWIHRFSLFRSMSKLPFSEAHGSRSTPFSLFMIE